MHLTRWEEKAYEGEFGGALESAYRVLVATGRLLKADRLIPVVSAHISGVNYSNIGDAGVEFLESFSREARVKVKTTLNPCGIDSGKLELFNPPAEFVRKQERIVGSYMRMGVSKSLSCIPYEIDNRPRRGSHVAWAESSACVFGNSVLGIRTNRESAVSALASAITGRTPNAGLHLDDAREPKLVVEVEEEPVSSLDYGILGIFSGRLTSETIGLTGIGGDVTRLKALSAGIGTSGASAMFSLIEKAPKGVERVPFTKKEASSVREQLSSDLDPEVILVGCPFYTVKEVSDLARNLEGRKLKKPMYVHLSRSVYAEARSRGLVKTIEESGGEVIKDMCPSLSPTPKWMGFSRVATDSAKGSYYMKSALKLGVNLLSAEDLVRKYA
ncbi:MAG TPA: aconitase X catalytic domain-containing protein [Conexivisphaerales archaeon]|nr:aconitase X catalytic domain-containing protein [Conexivisphaerales archaeon]